MENYDTDDHDDDVDGYDYDDDDNADYGIPGKSNDFNKLASLEATLVQMYEWLTVQLSD